MLFDRSNRRFNRWLVWAFALALPYAFMLVASLLPFEIRFPDAVAIIFVIPALLTWLLPFLGAAWAAGGLVEARLLRGEFRGVWMGWFALAVFLVWMALVIAGSPAIP